MLKSFHSLSSRAHVSIAPCLTGYGKNGRNNGKMEEIMEVFTYTAENGRKFLCRKVTEHFGRGIAPCYDADYFQFVEENEPWKYANDCYSADSAEELFAYIERWYA